MNENSNTPPSDDDAVTPKPVRARRAPAVKAQASVTPGPATDALGAAPPDPENPTAAPLRRRRKVEVGAPGESAVSATPANLHEATEDSAQMRSVETPAEPHHAASQELGEPRSAAPAAMGDADAPAGAPGQPREDDDSPRGRRRNRRDRKRRDRGDGLGDAAPDGAQGAEGDAAPRIQAAVAQAGELFAQVLSGAFDTDRTPAEGAPEPAEDPMAVDADSAAPGEVEAHKRILAADAEAPKLHKVLAQAGVGSRRDMEDMILDGRITVNGEPAHVGQRIAAGDQIKVNGKIVRVRIVPPLARLIAYHKPVGEIVTHDDPQNRPTVYRRLPRLVQGKWQSVGRLDINTEGLLLFTNSGELAHQLMHPRFGVEREYAVRVLGTLEPEAKARLLAGVEVQGQLANFRSIEDGGGEGVNRWYRVVIAEGRNREVRKLFDTVGLTVNRLIRIRYGSVVLPHGLKRGVWVDLDENEIRAVRRLAGGDRPPRQEAGNGRGPERGAERGPDRGAHQPRPRNDRGGGGHADRQRDPQRDPQRDSQRDPQRGRPLPHHAPQAQPERETALERGPDSDFDGDHDFDPRTIPNPLEQTFDKRFVQNPRSPAGGRGFGRGGGGFGAGGSAPAPASPRRGSGPKEPDPLQTSLGFIGADAFHRKSKGGPRGGGGGGGYGGGGGSGGGGGRRGR